MRRDLVQNNWSQSCLLPGVAFGESEEEKLFRAAKPNSQMYREEALNGKPGLTGPLTKGDRAWQRIYTSLKRDSLKLPLLPS